MTNPVKELVVFMTVRLALSDSKRYQLMALWCSFSDAISGCGDGLKLKSIERYIVLPYGCIRQNKASFRGLPSVMTDKKCNKLEHKDGNLNKK